MKLTPLRASRFQEVFDKYPGTFGSWPSHRLDRLAEDILEIVVKPEIGEKDECGCEAHWCHEDCESVCYAYACKYVGE